MFEIYRKAFLEGSDSTWMGGETISRTWDTGTMCLYFAIVLFTIIIGWQIERLKSGCNVKYSAKGFALTQNKPIKKRFFILFSVLAVILGCRHYTVGIDTIVYRNTIDDAVSLSQIFEDTTTEPLYKILQYLLHLIVGSGTVGVFLYSVITVYFVYIGIKKYFGEISIYVALMAYICIYYFPSMNLLRLYFAASIVFASMHLFIEGSYKKFYIILFMSCLIHYSTAVMFMPLCIYHIYVKNKRLALIGVGIIVLMIATAVNVLGDYIALLNRYSSYIEGNELSGGVGVMLFVDYLPAIYLMYYLTKNKIHGKWADFTVCFTCAALTVRLLAYYITIAGRLHAHFMFLTLILIPYWAYYLKLSRSKNYKMYLCICTIWALFRLHVYFIDYLAKDGIMPYKLAFW